MTLILSLMATGGKGNAAAAPASGERLGALPLIRTIYTQPATLSYGIATGTKFDEALGAMLGVLGRESGAGLERPFDFIVEVGSPLHGARMVMLQSDRDEQDEFLVGAVSVFGAARADRQTMSCKGVPDAGCRTWWRLDTFMKVAEALRACQ